VPSEGEDLDSFHVRNTYAVLEVSGVQGDGYEEGVERTRARLGSNRQSELTAEVMMGNGKERTKNLDPKEVELLGSLDRYVHLVSTPVILPCSLRTSYGFFTVPSHDRLILLPSAPFTRRISPVSAGPPSTSLTPTSLKSLPTPPQPARETIRISKWTRMLQPNARDQGGNVESWRIRSSKESKLRERVYKGIPDRWRGAVWDLLMSRNAKMEQREMNGLGRAYRDGLDKSSKYDVQIDLDVPRTISGHIMFKTRYGSGWVFILLIPAQGSYIQCSFG
jgi:hypothetical protein